MRKSEYLRLKAQLEEALSTAEATTCGIRRRLEALNVVWTEILSAPAEQNSAGESAASTEAEENSPQDSMQRHVIGNLVREVALALEEPFGVAEVETRIKAEHPELPAESLVRTTISGRLKRMAEDGELTVVEAGRGTRPSRYRRIKQAFNDL